MHQQTYVSAKLIRLVEANGCQLRELDRNQFVRSAGATDRAKPIAQLHNALALISCSDGWFFPKMFYIPLSYPTTFFLLGAIACSLLTDSPAWLTSILGFFITLFKWRTFKYTIIFFYELFPVPIKIFSADDFNLMRLLHHTSHLLRYKGHPQSHLNPIIAQRMNVIHKLTVSQKVNAQSKVLMIGSGISEVATEIHFRTGCSLIILDDDLQKVQSANTFISELQLWSNLQCILNFNLLDLDEFESGSFDLVICLEPTVWLTRGVAQAVTKELRRVARDDGLVHIESMVIVKL